MTGAGAPLAAGIDPSTAPAPSVHVVLVHPEIHWNTGNAGRTCLAAGARLHLIRPLGFSLSDRQVRRAGLDYWEHVDLRLWDSWADFEAIGPGAPGHAKTPSTFFFSSEGERSFWEARLTPLCVLVFGSESTGLPLELRRRHRDRLLKIPMPMRPGQPVRSLNLSTSVGVAVWEALRQRGGPDAGPVESPGSTAP